MEFIYKVRIQRSSSGKIRASFDFSSIITVVCETSVYFRRCQQLIMQMKKELLKSATEAARRNADKNTGIVSFINETILIANKNE